MQSKIVVVSFSLFVVFSATRGFADVILTFDSTSSVFGQDYGDRVQSYSQNGYLYGGSGELTPNIVVDYKPQSTFFSSGYGDLTNVLYNNHTGDGSTAFSLTLTADPGVEVLLHSFDLAGWPNHDYTIPLVEISRIVGDSASELLTQSNVLIQGDSDGPRRTTFSFDTPLQAQALKIVFDDFGARTLVGIDNIKFSQYPFASSITSVPEPSTLAFVSVGVLPLLLRSRLRRNVRTKVHAQS